jgi:hypothetical protein
LVQPDKFIKQFIELGEKELYNVLKWNSFVPDIPLKFPADRVNAFYACGLTAASK